MPAISIVTPWLNASELCRMYERSTRGAQIVVVDNGSDWEHARQIEAMCLIAGGVYVRQETNTGFSRANNLGLQVATGEIVIFMNNDVQCREGWLDAVRRDVKPGVIAGPSLLHKHGWAYLEGWCIAARRDVWDALHGWDDEYYTGLYWEDNDLCYRAQRAGYGLTQTDWPVWHRSNYTTSKTPGAYDHSAANERLFLERIRCAS